MTTEQNILKISKLDKTIDFISRSRKFFMAPGESPFDFATWSTDKLSSEQQLELVKINLDIFYAVDEVFITDIANDLTIINPDLEEDSDEEVELFDLYTLSLSRLNEEIGKSPVSHAMERFMKALFAIDTSEDMIDILKGNEALLDIFYNLRSNKLIQQWFQDTQSRQAQDDTFVTGDNTELTEEEKALLEEEEALRKEEEALADEEKVLADEEKVLADEEKVLADEEKVLADEDKVLADEEKVLADEEKVLADEEKVLADEENVLADEEKVLADEEKKTISEPEISEVTETPKSASTVELEQKHVKVDETQSGIAEEIEKMSRLKQKIINEIDRLEASNSSKGNFFVNIGVIEASDPKVHALIRLSEILKNSSGLDKDQDSFHEELRQWKETNMTCIAKQRNCVHSFFSPNHKPRVVITVEEIFAELGVVDNATVKQTIAYNNSFDL